MYLGINERNSDYIRVLNSKKHHLFAKNKYKTKEFLRSRNIPVPTTYAYFKNRIELRKFNFNSLNKPFVIKPNRGMSGNGILIIKQKKSDNIFETINGDIINKNDIIWHCEMIMDGFFDKYGYLDNVLIEQFIDSFQFIENYKYNGLADIRVIVVNLIPIIAMLRIPYKTNTANISQGAIAIGIDIVDGNFNGILSNKSINDDFVEKCRKIKIPFWDKILYYSSYIQSITKIGYLSVDFAISSNSEIYVIEINSRSGLKIQLANGINLKERLEKVIKIKNNDIKKGIEISKYLFSNKSFSINKFDYDIFSVNEDLYTFLNDGTKIKLNYKIDLYQKETLINPILASKLLSNQNKAYIKLYFKDKKIDIIAKIDTNILHNDIIIGSNDLKNFLIKL